MTNDSLLNDRWRFDQVTNDLLTDDVSINWHFDQVKDNLLKDDVSINWHFDQVTNERWRFDQLTFKKDDVSIK